MGRSESGQPVSPSAPLISHVVYPNKIKYILDELIPHIDVMPNRSLQSLFRAVINQDIGEVTKWVEMGVSCKHEINGWTVYTLVVLVGSIEIFLLLLNFNVYRYAWCYDIATDVKTCESLLIAIKYGHNSIAKLLIQENCVDSTALGRAYKIKNLELIDLLLDKSDTDIRYVNITPIEMLFSAIQNGEIAIIKLLMKHNYDFQKTLHAETPLQRAYAIHQLKIASLIENYLEQQLQHQQQLERNEKKRCSVM